jgi:polyisoprenoid-binding protein YceI
VSPGIGRADCGFARGRTVGVGASLRDGAGRAVHTLAPAMQIQTNMNTHSDSRGAAGSAAVESIERWEFDPTGSALEFTLRHLVIQEIRGRFHRWGGTLFVNRAQPSRSRLDVWVELDSLDTGSEERDAHVRSSEFLDVGKFPRARFVSTLVEASNERIVVRGNLHLCGVSRELELEVIPGPLSRDSRGALRSAYAARGTIHRQAFGLHWNQDLDVGGVVVGDRIELSIKAEMVQVSNGDATRLR